MQRRARTGRAAAAVIVLTMIVTSCGWARYRADTRHTGSNPLEHQLSPDNLATVQPVWTTVDRHFAFEPLVSGDRVFPANRGSIYAFDAATGAELWRRTNLRETHDVSWLGQPTTGAGRVYVTNYWYDAQPTTTTGATTFALDPATGNTLASYHGGNVYFPALVTDDGWLYLAPSAPRLDAYGPEGERFSVPTPVGVTDMVADDGVVRAKSGNTVQTIDRHGCDEPTCTAIRVDRIPGAQDAGGMLAENSHSVFALSGGMLYAYPRDGCGDAVCDPAWSSRSGRTGTSGLAVTDQAVYVTAFGPMRVFDAHGCGEATCTPRWTTAGEFNTTVGSPTVANGMVLGSESFANGNADLAAWGTARCSTPPCAPLVSLPGVILDHMIVSDGAIYTTASGTLQKLAPPA